MNDVISVSDLFKLMFLFEVGKNFLAFLMRLLRLHMRFLASVIVACNSSLVIRVVSIWVMFFFLLVLMLVNFLPLCWEIPCQCLVVQYTLLINNSMDLFFLISEFSYLRVTKHRISFAGEKIVH
jgi:hypothetical protein